ncbi:MAG TPA: outer-membrane lipoprotein carrier protein LolA [Terriglobales bacterium]|jgi:outer membrane lipoprotein-sorting protein|nr:outer-membrane lipoprotein carrier protein LolA [Terriglobales bacterium]
MKPLQSIGWLILAVAWLPPVVAAQAPSNSQSNPALERVLSRMDDAAATFRTTEADVTWDQYQKVVDEHETQKGKVYFRRSGDEIQMAADITDPDQKYVLFNGSKVQVYQPRIEQVTVYNTGKNRDEVESFLVLGFGGRGHDLLKSFDVKYLGSEKVGDQDAAKLGLVPKAANVRNNIDHIILWIDLSRGISVQQQFFFGSSGDYRLAKYSDIKINEKIPDSAFKLKTSGKTKFISPQG